MESLIGKRFSKYEIQAEIGRGGMGVVYLGYDTMLKRPVAIKVLPPSFSFDQEFVERFHREAILAANLHHPNIVTIHDVGEQEGYHYIVMEYLEGETLDQWLRHNGAMSPQQAAPVLQQLASALDYAHSRGVVHRDVKPSNVMIAPDGRAKLMDFGLVRAGEGSNLTRSGVVLGTPEYMAPEQALGEPVDGRTDIYALGVVLFRMLTGHVPFARTTPYAVTYAHIHEPPPALRGLRPDLPAAIDAVVLKTLAKNPADRYQRASLLAQDFEAAAASGGRLTAVPVAPTPTGRDAPRPAGSDQTRKTPPGRTPTPAPAPARKQRSLVPLLIGLTALLLVVVIGIFLVLNPPWVSQVTPTLPPVATEPPAISLATSNPQPSPLPTQAPVATPTPRPAQPTPRPSPTTATPTLRPTFTPTPRATATSTRPPTATPTAAPPTATASPTRQPATATTPATPRPTAPPSTPGVILDFENFGIWRRGDQPYGTFTQTQEQVHSGNYAAKLSYDIPNVADSFVVFLRTPPASAPGQPQTLTIWVYGDGSNHFLNAWVRDSQSEMRQFTFGRIAHAGSWQPMTLLLDTAADWPQGHISGPDNGRLDYPISVAAIVLDAVGSSRSTGVVYLDDLGVGEASGAVSTPSVRATTSASPAATSAVVQTALSGYIVYAAGGNTITVLEAATGNTWPIASNARQPDIHGDGLVVADGIGGGRDNLFVVSLNGSERVISMHPEDSYPSWNPAGDGVVFHSTQQGDGNERIYIQWSTGSAQEPTRLRVGATEVFGRNATWLADGRIAFSGCAYWQSGGGSLCGIWTIGPDGGSPFRLTERANDISSDSWGSQVLYSSSVTGNWEVYAIPLGGGAARNLTNSPSQDAAATFAPNGQHIAFISDRDGGWGIWVMNADGGSPRKLATVPTGFGQFWYNERLAWGP